MEQTLIFLGDVMLGRLVNEELKHQPANFVWGDTLPILRKASACFINLECAITDFGEPIPDKVFCFRTDSKNLEILKEAKITGVSLANNHILDYEGEGLIETIKNLKRAGIAFAGVGENLESAQEPALVKIGKLRIAFICATDNEPTWEATAQKPGIFYMPLDLDDKRVKKLISLVSCCSKMADLVIVSLHWGPNWGYEPLPEHQLLAHHLIDQGADIIFGHSPHVFQGIEIYKNRPVLYSCGDFVDDYAVDEVERNDQSFIFQVHLREVQVTRLALIPTMITDFHARLARDFNKEIICQKMSQLCERLGTKTVQAEEGLTIPLL